MVSLLFLWLCQSDDWKARGSLLLGGWGSFIKVPLETVCMVRCIVI